MGMSSGGVGDIISNLINTGVQLYAANGEQGNLENAANSIQAAPYDPVNFGNAMGQTVSQDQGNLSAINALDATGNADITGNFLKRANALIPGYTASMNSYGADAGNLLSGRLPFSDVLNTISGQGEATNALGIAGTGTNATLQDLGLSELQGMQTGGGMLSAMVGIAGQIAPTSDYMLPQNMMLTPSQTLPLDIEQAQLEQQSNQGIDNAAAQRAYAMANANNLPLTALSNASTQAVNSYTGSNSSNNSAGMPYGSGMAGAYTGSSGGWGSLSQQSYSGAGDSAAPAYL